MDKTYVFDSGSGSQSSIDPNLWAALNNGGGGFGGGAFNNPFWALILLAFLRNGFGWSGDGNNCNTAFVSSQLGQAIQGNANAISNLATSLNCTEGQIQSAIAAVQSSIQQLSSQSGMNAMQIINAVNSGNATIANQLQSCCCDVKNLVTVQGYENRIANTEQTATLGGKIDHQTTVINDKFCQLEMREMQSKIDALREERATLKGIIDNANQTSQIAAMIAPLKSDIDSIKCKLPDTATIPYSPVVGIPSCVAAQYGLAGLGLTPYGTGNIWG